MHRERSLEAMELSFSTLLTTPKPLSVHFLSLYYLDPPQLYSNSLYQIRSIHQLDTSYFDEITIGGIVGVKNGSETHRAIVMDFHSKRNTLAARLEEVIEKFEAQGKPAKYQRQYNSYKLTDAVSAQETMRIKQEELYKLHCEFVKLKMEHDELQNAQLQRRRQIQHDFDSTPKRFKRAPLVNIQQNIVVKPAEPIDLSKKTKDAVAGPSTPPVTPKNFNVDFNEMVTLGSGGTQIKRSKFDALPWKKNPRLAARNLLQLLFGREHLATHCLSGKRSPAFLHKPRKEQLDPVKVRDVMEILLLKTTLLPFDIRSLITTTCADEDKMRKRRSEVEANKKRLAIEANKKRLENEANANQNKEN